MDFFEGNRVLITTLRAEIIDNLAKGIFNKDLLIEYYRNRDIIDPFKQADDLFLELLNFDFILDDVNYNEWFSTILIKDYEIPFYGDFLKVYFNIINKDTSLEQKLLALEDLDVSKIPDGDVKKLYYFLTLEVLLAIRPMDLDKIKIVNEQLKNLI